MSVRNTQIQSRRGRKALATMGRRGGQKAAERWKTDPNGEYARENRQRLARANELRTFSTDENKGRILAYVSECKRHGYDPTSKEVATELGLSVSRVNELRKTLGISRKRGRPSA